MSMDVREVRPHDWLAIEALHQRARRSIPRLWWWEEHLTRAPFILIEDTGLAMGALFAWPDDSPVAWVRLPALDDTLEVSEWLVLALPPIVDRLRRMGTRTLAWMDYGGWAGPYLGAQGFQRLDTVMTLAKSNRALPQVNSTDARIRLASDVDIPAIVAVDRAAFTSHWWHSEATLRRRASTSPYFAVAERAGQVAAYAEATLHPPTAHLNRIAVHPAHQNHGIGAALLHAAVRTFWRYGAEKVTLNTQTDNRPSQRLYRRFGFEPTGDSLTVWELRL